MKLNFTKNGNNYSLETIREFAKDLSVAFTTGERSGKIKFVADFALSSLRSNDKIDFDEIDDIMFECGPWFGIKELGEIGFNNDEYRVFVFDYYGGGSHHSVEVNMFDEAEDIEGRIFDIIAYDIYELDKNDTNWLILVQLNEDKPITDDRDEDTKRIEDEAVKNFAEMLTDYAQGVQAAGYDGIGVEDIQDKLYEYLNWDKKYTPEYEAGRNNR